MLYVSASFYYMSIGTMNKFNEWITSERGKIREKELQIAAAFGYSHTAVYNWRKNYGVPLKHVPKVAELTGLTPAEIRPDFFK